MTVYAATMAYPCPCGAITHVFLECDEDPALAPLICWHCDEAIGLALASRLWSASSANGACRLRLIGWDAGHGRLPRNPADHEPQVWRVV